MADTPITVATAQVVLLLNSEAFRTQLATVLQPMTKTVTAKVSASASTATQQAATSAGKTAVGAAQTSAAISKAAAKDAAMIKRAAAEHARAEEMAVIRARKVAATEEAALQSRMIANMQRQQRAAALLASQNTPEKVAMGQLRGMGFSQATINNPFYQSQLKSAWQLEKAATAWVITTGRLFRAMTSGFGLAATMGGAAMGLSVRTFLRQGSAEVKVYESALARIKDGLARIGGDVFKTRFSMPKIPFTEYGGGPSRSLYEWAEHLAKWLNSVDISKVQKWADIVAHVAVMFGAFQASRWVARIAGEMGHLLDRTIKIGKALAAWKVGRDLRYAMQGLGLSFVEGHLVAKGAAGGGRALGGAIAEGAGYAATSAIFAGRAAGRPAITTPPGATAAGKMSWVSAGSALTALSVGFSNLGSKLASFAGSISSWILGIPSAIARFASATAHFASGISVGAFAVNAASLGLAAGIGTAIGSLLRLIPAVEHAADWFANLFYGDPEKARKQRDADEAEWRKGDVYKAYKARMVSDWVEKVAIANRRINLGRATSRFQEEHAEGMEFAEAQGRQTSIDEYIMQWKQAEEFANKLTQEITALRKEQQGLNQDSDEYKRIQEQIAAFDKDRKAMYGIQKTAISEVVSQIEKRGDAEQRVSEAKESKDEAIKRITEDTAERIAEMKERKPKYSKMGADQLGDSLSKSLIESWEKRRQIEKAEKREAKELERINDPNSPQNRAIRHAEEQLSKLGEAFTKQIVEVFRKPSQDLKDAAESLQKMYRQMQPLSSGM